MSITVLPKQLQHTNAYVARLVRDSVVCDTPVLSVCCILMYSPAEAHSRHSHHLYTSDNVWPRDMHHLTHLIFKRMGRTIHNLIALIFYFFCWFKAIIARFNLIQAQPFFFTFSFPSDTNSSSMHASCSEPAEQRRGQFNPSLPRGFKMLTFYILLSK